MRNWNQRRLWNYKTDVYRIYDISGSLLYVGSSVNAYSRIPQHKPYAQWFPFMARVRIEEYIDRPTAERVEATAIAHESPLYNVTHYPTLLLKTFPKPLEIDDFFLPVIGVW